MEDLFHFVLAALHDSEYLAANADGLRLGWPRLPLPGWSEDAGEASASAERFHAAAARGRELAQLLDPDRRVASVTAGQLRPEIASIAVPTTIDGHQMVGDDFALTAGWGHFGTGDAVMPGHGRAVERSYTAAERKALGEAVSVLGESTLDIYLNTRTFWRNVPAAVWEYRLGGYQVLKKWLSYRERDVLGRPLKLDEVQHFVSVSRRISALSIGCPPESQPAPATVSAK